MATNAAKKQQQHVSASSARTVTVACKIPNGLKLQLQRPVERMEDTPMGPKPKTYWAFHGRAWFVHGPAYPVGTTPKGFPKPVMIEGGYAITTGIPADFWEQWVKQNEKSSFVVAPDGAEHGMIFAYDDLDSVVSAAREQGKLLSGLEPLSDEVDKNGRLTDPRVPTPINQSIAKVGYERHPNNG